MKSHDPSCPCEPLLQLAMDLMKRGNFRDAITAYDKITAIHPDDCRAWSNKGVCHSDLKENDKALECLDRAIQLDPFYVYALSTKASILAQSGKLAEASALMDRALEIDPNFLDALLNKSALLIQQKRHEESKHFIARCLTIQPANRRAMMLKIRSIVDPFIAKHPRSNLLEGTSKGEEQGFREIMECLDPLMVMIKENPRNFQAYRYAAILFYLLRHPNARDMLETASKHAASDTVVAQCLLQLDSEE